MALLMYRATPILNGYSQAELSCNRKFRTSLPIMPNRLKSSIPDTKAVQDTETSLREKSKINFDLRNQARCNSELKTGDDVIIQDKNVLGKIVEKHSSPRSYITNTPTGLLRRNRIALSKLEQQDNVEVIKGTINNQLFDNVSVEREC